MLRVPLDEIRPGAELAQAILDPAGRVLLRAGARLTAPVIASLERWGVASAVVIDGAPDAQGPVPATPPVHADWASLFAPHSENDEAGRIRAALEIWVKGRGMRNEGSAG